MQGRKVDYRDPPEVTPEQWLEGMQRRVPEVFKPARRASRRGQTIRDKVTGETWVGLAACARAIGMTPTGVHDALKSGNRTRSGRLLEYVSD